MDTFEISHLQNLLKKPPASRTQRNIKKIQSYLRSLLFFQDIRKDLPSEDLLECCKHLQCQSYYQGQLITNSQDLSFKIFIILKGKVVYKNNQNETLRSYTEGSVFGDSILTTTTEYSIYSNSSLAVIGFYSEAKYKTILGKYREEKKIALANFLNSQKAFNKWPKGSIIELVKHTVEINYDKGAEIFKKGEDADGFYIVLDGEVVMIGRIVSRLENGEIFGIEDVKDCKARSCSCVASRKSVFLFVSKWDYSNIKHLWSCRHPLTKLDSPIKASEEILRSRIASAPIHSRKIMKESFSNTIGNLFVSVQQLKPKTSSATFLSKQRNSVDNSSRSCVSSWNAMGSLYKTRSVRRYRSMARY